MFYAIELLRTLGAVHASGVAHGALSPASILLRNGLGDDDEWGRTWNASGASGWNMRGVALFDWSQAVSMHSQPDVMTTAELLPEGHQTVSPAMVSYISCNGNHSAFFIRDSVTNPFVLPCFSFFSCRGTMWLWRACFMSCFLESHWLSLPMKTAILQ